MDGCVELRCRIARARLESLEHVLGELGALAVTLTGGDSDAFAEPGQAEPELWPHFEVRALFPADAPTGDLVARIRSHCGADLPVTFAILAAQDWSDAWKDGWVAQVFAGGLCVCPTWLTPPDDAGAVVWLDPGQAFGTGTHETTALCLDWLAKQPGFGGLTVLDYGCGSGVLALAAARLGAKAVWAVDVDPGALEVARANVDRNGLGAVVQVGAPEIAEHADPDVLVANILLAPLLSLEARFARLLAPGGRLVLSGVLAPQTARVLEAYGARFTMDAPVLRGEWALLSGTRR